MNSFIYENQTKIIFGKDSLDSMKSQLQNIGTRILLHYGGGSIKRTGLYDKIKNILEEGNFIIYELGGVKPNPRLSLVYEGIELCKREEIDLILAVGGGSVIDSAKAIAIGVKSNIDVWDYFEGKDFPKQALPIATVLTFPAAGSENSTGTVITKEDGLLKRATGGPCVRPKISFLNPELAFTLPKYQIACGVIDILAHMMERYFTNTKQVALTDALIEATMRTVIDHAPRVIENPNNYDAWAEIMWAGTIAHNGLLDTGRVSDWATHDIEHELSGIYDIAHGAGLAIMFPAWMKYVNNQDPKRFVKFFVEVFGIQQDYFNDEDTIKRGIEAYQSFVRKIGLPTNLKEIGIDGSKLSEMSKKATNNDAITLGQFVKLSSEDIKRIYELALE